jgi:hypothetical protein
MLTQLRYATCALVVRDEHGQHWSRRVGVREPDAERGLSLECWSDFVRLTQRMSSADAELLCLGPSGGDQLLRVVGQTDAQIIAEGAPLRKAWFKPLDVARERVSLPEFWPAFRVSLRITDSDSLMEAAIWLHDGYFAVGDVLHDPAKGTLSLTGKREELHVTRQIPWLRFFRRTEAAFIGCQLGLERVEDLTVDRGERSRVMLTGMACKPVEGGVDVKVESAPPVDLHIRVSEISGVFEDTGGLPAGWQ